MNNSISYAYGGSHAWYSRGVDAPGKASSQAQKYDEGVQRSLSEHASVTMALTKATVQGSRLGLRQKPLTSTRQSDFTPNLMNC